MFLAMTFTATLFKVKTFSLLSIKRKVLDPEKKRRKKSEQSEGEDEAKATVESN